MLSYQDKIKRYINQRGITQAEFARRANICKRKLSSWMSQKKKVQPWDAEKLDSFFNVQEG